MGKYDLYLKKQSDGSKSCTFCDKNFNKQKDGNTNVYLNHFKKFHIKVFQKIQGNSLARSEDEPPAKKSQPLIDECFSEFSENGPKSLAIQRAIAQLISSAALPLSLIEHPGFKNLLHLTVPRFRPKSRLQLTRNELPALYDEYRDKLKMSLASSEDVSVSFDGWTDSSQKHEYLALIVHFVEENKPAYRILEVVDVSAKSHTGEFLAEKMKSAIDFFGISTKIRCCVRDGAANARSASVEICDVNFDCLGHKLNLAAKAGTANFAGLDSLVLKLKKITKKIRMSSNLRREWEQIFEEMDAPTLVLKKHVETRWTSLYEALKRAIRVKEQLELFLQDQDNLEFITASEWKTCEAVLDMLQPLNDSIKLVQVCGNLEALQETEVQLQARSFSASSIIPVCRVILADLQTKKKHMTARTKIIEKLSEELEKYTNLKYLNIATLLDVRFKSGFVDSKWKDELLTMMLATITAAEEGDSDSDNDGVTDVSQSHSDPFSRFLQSSSSKISKVPLDKKSVLVGVSNKLYMMDKQKNYRNMIGGYRSTRTLM
ncbi:hypothetical protein B9Z55_008750 [Caenorhabditis nigoni]|uniref:BED-type domain-containing protein n=1 Tax=Caenorhabditis nigoni TaxID=1611254 RepID=A0A2G5UPA7_9PELO|nr:hypothetical protein B9Z55_008750 [Caenorhabditis nigoni]